MARASAAAENAALNGLDGTGNSNVIPDVSLHVGDPGTYPPNDTGSDGLSVAKAAQQLGAIAGYTHAFGLDHVLGAAMTGPLIIGTRWHSDMFNPDPRGVVHPTGPVEGGHEYCLDAVYAEAKMLRFLNSWSKSWGANGYFYMSFADFSTLLADHGDAVLFTPKAA